MAKLPQARNDPERFNPLFSVLRNRKEANAPFTLTAEQIDVVVDALFFAMSHQSLWTQWHEWSRRQWRGLEALRGWDARTKKRTLEDRLRVAVNRMLGRADDADFREFAAARGETVKWTQRDYSALKQDFDDLAKGRPNPRYLWLYTTRGEGCPLHEHRDPDISCSRCWPRLVSLRCGQALTLQSLTLRDGRGCALHEEGNVWCHKCWERLESVDPLDSDEAEEAVRCVHGFSSPKACRQALRRAGVESRLSSAR